MARIKQVISSLCCTFLISVAYPVQLKASSYNHNSANSFLVPLAAGALGVAGICTLGYCLRWWGHESNEQIISSCRQALQSAEQYHTMIAILRGSDMHVDYAPFNEQVLYQLAFAKRGGLSIESFIATLVSDMYQAKNLCKKAENRSLELKHQANWEQLRSVCYELDCLHKDLYAIIKQLELLHLTLQRHASYFYLFEYEDYIRNYYASELLLVEQYHESYQLKEGIRVCAFSKYKGPFALIDFVKRLKVDIQTLENSIFRSAYNYAIRIGYAQDIANRLKHIEHLILADHEYAHALIEYQRDQREKERLALEKERIKLEQQKISLQAREVSAREVYNTIKVAEIIDHSIRY